MPRLPRCLFRRIRVAACGLVGLVWLHSLGSVRAGEEAAAALEDVRRAVDLFVNARTAGSTDAFVVAVAKVKEMADAGQTFFRFLLGVHAGQEPLCGLSDEQRTRYLDEGRPLMRAHAREGNALAQYLIGLDCDFNLNKPDEARD
ncbi:MAG TPA: hypothetical protein PL176_10820, partial [Kiritimatiellia bacterium]|nr:hypothetical protein [Kiritimatiellia bacterium]